VHCGAAEINVDMCRPIRATVLFLTPTLPPGQGSQLSQVKRLIPTHQHTVSLSHCSRHIQGNLLTQLHSEIFAGMTNLAHL
jgi:hypothetical protein